MTGDPEVVRPNRCSQIFESGELFGVVPADGGRIRLNDENLFGQYVELSQDFTLIRTALRTFKQFRPRNERHTEPVALW